MDGASQYPPELRARAVRMVAEVTLHGRGCASEEHAEIKRAERRGRRAAPGE